MTTFFLDCDGVITDKKARVDERILNEMKNLISSSNYFVLITGRSLGWIKENVISSFSKEILRRDRVFLIGEYGNQWASFLKGKLVEEEDLSASVEGEVRMKVLKEMKRFPLLRFDHVKRTFVSMEVKHELLDSVEKERRAQVQLDDATDFFRALLPEYDVHRTTYALDIVKRGVGKRKAAKKAMELSRPRYVIVIGDSPNDLEMGDELLSKGIPFQFWYVGERRIGTRGFKVYKTKNKYSEGTLEVLEGFSLKPNAII